MPFVLIPTDPPDPRGVSRTGAACAVGLVVFRAFQLRVPHALDGDHRLLSRVDAIENDAVQPDVQRLLNDPLRLIGLGRKAREQRDIRLQVALLENHRPIGHSHQEQVKRGEIQRVVLQIRVHKVDRRARDLTSVRKGQITGVESIDRSALRQFCDDWVEVQRLLLRQKHARRQDEQECQCHPPVMGRSWGGMPQRLQHRGTAVADRQGKRS